jgi:ribosomal protein S18 acetylase RimI-like enzyme
VRPGSCSATSAYLLVAVVDGHAHLEQVSVRPEYARRGIGRRLGFEEEGLDAWPRAVMRQHL